MTFVLKARRFRIIVLASITILVAVQLIQSFHSINTIKRTTTKSGRANSTITTSFATEPAAPTTYNFTTAICAIVKDAETYLTEWLDYNLLALEFENVYLYDNSDNFDLETWYNNTRSHPVYSRVHIEHKSGKYLDDEEIYVQNWAYTDCIMRFGQGYRRDKNSKYEEVWKDSPQHDYMVLIDFDEYIVFQQEEDQDSDQQQGTDKYKLATTTPATRINTIHDLLNTYLVPYGGALSINWVLMGTANKTLYSPLPVLKRFQYREDAKPHSTVKTIVKSNDFVSSRNPHAVKLVKDKQVHDTLYPGNVAKLSPKGASNSNRPDAVVLLYHYRYMSDKEYFNRRCFRGEADENEEKGSACLEGKGKATTNEKFIARPGEVFDDKAWKFLTSKVSKYQVYDSDEWQDLTR
mmetsp:Transcript_28579/g.42378  ORF Transcript_28579/g.42378 Transcript_28579/m.42378 type:complete len:407 (+) Transcript_28579:137-1357(+)